MRQGIVLVLMLMMVSGCAKAKYLKQLLILKGLADEQTEMAHYVEAKDQTFQLMLAEMEAGRIEDYSSKTKVLRTFGNPIFIKQVEESTELMESWLYRYSTDFFGSDKIYLYFDEDETLVDWKYVKGDHGEIR